MSTDSMVSGIGRQSLAQFECIHRRFEALAYAQPEAVALVYEGDTLTYGALEARANQWAHRLRAIGVGPEVLVAISLERSLELIIALLAVLKAGGAYVPLDPDYPEKRLEFTLRDAAAPVLITSERLRGRFATYLGQIVCPDAESEALSELPTTVPDVAGASGDACYVIYTSGSTGQNKGVVVTHRNVCRLMSATDAWFSFGAHDVWTLFHSFAFDFSVWEIWGALAFGGRLVIVPYASSRSPLEFHALLRREQVTVLNQTPSAFRQLMWADAQCPDSTTSLALRVVIFGGEALDFRVLKAWVEKHGIEHPRLVNMYGITETTVHVTYYPLVAGDVDSAASRVGMPIPDLRIHVLDETLRPVPVGGSGEIYVAGAGLARGYLNRPELTAERFIPDPFSPGTDERLYRTGDLATLCEDGGLAFLGRIDHQVKVRGFRIELGEIEACLETSPAVASAVVTVRSDTSGEARLIAYVVPTAGTTVDVKALRTSLGESLPEHMIPAVIVPIAALPLTSNGKLDRAQLPDPATLRTLTARRAPRDDRERLLVELWSTLLDLDAVGIDEDFFDLGGHSLLVVRFLEALQNRGASGVTALDLFDNPTIEALAAKVRLPNQPQPEGSSASRTKCVRLLKAGQEPRPVYFMHAGPHEFRIARSLASARPIYGVEVPWPNAWREAALSNHWSASPTFDQLADSYAEAMLTQTLTGPVTLAGYCLGGQLAFEVAHRLRRAGVATDCVLLFDSEATLPSAWRIAALEMGHCWRGSAMSPAPGRRVESTRGLTDRWRYAREIVAWLWRQQLVAFRRRYLKPKGPLDFPSARLDEAGKPVPFELCVRTYARMLATHVPKPLEARGVLFKAEGGEPGADELPASRDYDASFGWQGLFTREFKCIAVAGDHHSMLFEHGPALADAVDKVLDPG